MISPYVRRLRLAGELRRLREAAGFTHEELAARVRENRAKISRLENGRIAPDSGDVVKLLDAMGVDGPEWTRVMAIAQEAGTRGWWESTARIMGERQALYANLEAGARTIREYQQSLLPGLAQIPEYTRSRLSPVLAGGQTARGIVEGRAGRQRMLRRPDGPAYEVVLDEVAVRRKSAPPDVMRDQLVHLAERAASGDLIVRVLPVDADIEGWKPPTCTFSLYEYPDPGDPVVVAIEAVTTDIVLTVPDEVAHYGRRYALLRDAALSVGDSAAFLADAAHRLSHPQETTTP